MILKKKLKKDASLFKIYMYLHTPSAFYLTGLIFFQNQEAFGLLNIYCGVQG